MTRPRVRSIELLAVTAVLALFLTACGGDNSDDSDRSFAPEAQGDVALPTNTAAPTSTVGPLGPAKYLLTGIDSYVLVNLDDGKTRDLHVARTQFTTAAVSPDGKQVLLIDRAGGAPRVQMLSAKGASEATWSPPDAGTPIASPVAAQTDMANIQVVIVR